MAEDTQAIDWQSISDTLNANHVPEIILIVAGVVALLIVWAYLKDKESGRYKLLELLGVIVGVITVILCLSSPMKAEKYTVIIVAIGSFALILRPFRDVPFALIIAIIGMVVTYIALGDMTGNLEVLASGWPRIIVAFVVGAIIFMLLFFLQNMVQFLAKLLNAWPVLIVVGIICILEGISLWTGHGSIINMITDTGSTASMIGMLL